MIPSGRLTRFFPMAKQLKLSFGDQVVPTALHREMQRSYLEYAMSVIIGRALPDVRDGLKPVHRRILYAVHELGLTPQRPYRKCARVVGDVLGKYHPHGDQAVYDALVRLVQDFNCRYPLLGGHGNFGSLDNDPAAAMRYTETRLAGISHEALLAEVSPQAVDYAPNFDGSHQEPQVLPAQLPFLLLNGSTGIAVGMATHIPPHNLGEVVEGLIALIDHPDLGAEQLLQLIPGPDFPGGGEIINPQGIREAYTTGRGTITVRGRTHLEQGKRGRQQRTLMVVEELPYAVNKAAWIEKVAQLVTEGHLVGIADLRDESDREGMRVVLELRREVNPPEVLMQLHKQTALESNFGVIFLAIVDGQPRQLTLKQILEEFIQFREQTLRRRYTYELGQTQTRQQVVAGILRALENLDQVILVLRQARDRVAAKAALGEQLQLSVEQVEAVLAVPLGQLISLEQAALEQEQAQLVSRAGQLQRYLQERRELLKVIKRDLRSLKRRFGDPRRTRISPPSPP